MSANNSHNQIESSSSSDSDDFNYAQTWEDFTISPPTSPESRQQSLVERQRVDQSSSSSEGATRPPGRRMMPIRKNMKRMGTFIQESKSSDSSGSSPTIKRRKSIAKQGSSSQTQLGTTEDMPFSLIVPTIYANPRPGPSSTQTEPTEEMYANPMPGSSSQTQFDSPEDMPFLYPVPTVYPNPRPGTSSSSEEDTHPLGKRMRSIMEKVKRIGTLMQESDSSDSSVRSPIIKRRKSIARESSFSQTAVEQSSTDSSDNEIGPSQTQYIPTLFPAIHGLPTVPTGQQSVPVHEDNIEVVNLASDDEDDLPICPKIVNRLVFDISSDE